MKRALTLTMAAAIMELVACGPKTAAFGNAMSTCELGQLPSTLEMVIAEVAGILMGGADRAWQTDLEQLAAKLAPGQLDCVVQAVGAGIKGRLVKGQMSPEYVEAGRRADAWLARGKR